MSIELSAIGRPFKYFNEVGKKNDSRTRTITDFVGGVGSGKEFAVVSGNEIDFSVDSVNTRKGTESVKVTAEASASKVFGTGTIITRDLSNYVSGILSFHVDNVANLNSVVIYGHTSTGLESYSVTVPNVKTGWNTYSFNRAEFALNGVPAGWDSIQRWQFRVIASSAGTVNVTFDSLVFYNPENTNSLVTLSFDDVYLSVLSIAIPAIEAMNAKSTIFVTPSLVGTENHLSVSQLQEIVSRGHTLGAHGYNHTDYSGLSMSAMRADIDKTIDWFVANSLPVPSHLAYPGGNAVGVQKEAIAKERFIFARGTSNATDYDNLDTLPFAYPEHLRSYGMSSGAVAINAALDRMVENRAVINLYSHDLTEAGGSPATAIADFNAILAKIVSLGFEVLSFDLLYRRYPRSLFV